MRFSELSLLVVAAAMAPVVDSFFFFPDFSSGGNGVSDLCKLGASVDVKVRALYSFMFFSVDKINIAGRYRCGSSSSGARARRLCGETQ